MVGTGIAGAGCAWYLRDAAALELFEKDGRAGGHTNTVAVDEGGRAMPVDTGFIVFNRVTYPNLCRLFEELGVEAVASEMSFSVRHDASGLEYNGMGLNKLFAQRRNVFSPRFHRLIFSILRFFRVARAELEHPPDLTLREFVEKHRLGQDFLEFYLVPMSSAVWSTEPGAVLDFPAATLLRFFSNHGFLGVLTHHQWFTVRGGARTYLGKIFERVGQPNLSAPVVAVEEGERAACLVFEGGERREFDRVVLACHADQALRLLKSPTALQSRLLPAFAYQRNHATLHTWPGLMPRERRAWASWNYRVDSGGKATVHYWMNALQPFGQRRNYFVSLNSREEIPSEAVLYETVYEHPVFTREAIRAQERLPNLNCESRNQRVFFCGSYFKYGFHEDALSSSLYLAELLKERLGAG